MPVFPPVITTTLSDRSGTSLAVHVGFGGKLWLKTDIGERYVAGEGVVEDRD